MNTSYTLHSTISDTKKSPILKVSLHSGSGEKCDVLSIQPQVIYRAPDTLDLDIFHPSFKWSTTKSKRIHEIRGEDDTACLSHRVTQHSTDVLRITTKMKFRHVVRVEKVCDICQMAEGAIEDVWTPHLTPEADMVISETVMRTPVIAMRTASALVAVLPNPRYLCAPGKPLAAECDRENGSISFGCIPHRETRSTYFAHTDSDVLDTRHIIEYTYYVFVQPCDAKDDMYHILSQRIWKLFGGNCLGSLEKATDNCADVRLGIMQLEEKATAEDGTPKEDIRYLPQDLQAAYGRALWGRAHKENAAIEVAHETVELLLSSPQRKGVFPVIYATGSDDPWRYGSICGPGGQEDMYRFSDQSWSCYWLLKMHRECKETSGSIEYAENYAKTLLQLQKRGGHIPTWVRKDGLTTVRILNRSAEVSAHIIFLSLLHSISPQEEYAHASRRLGSYLIRQCCRQSRWETTELYYSHSPIWSQKKPGRKATRQKRYAAHIRALRDVAWALHDLYKLTGTPRYLAEGRRTLDELSLYQQIWQPETVEMSCNGGFPDMNTDTVWNSSETFLMPHVYFSYYTTCGYGEYMQRGIAALKVCHAWATDVSNAVIDGHLTLKQHTLQKDSDHTQNVMDNTIMAGEAIHQTYGDLYVDTSRTRAFGIDGIDVVRVEQELVGTVVYARNTLEKERKIHVCSDNGMHLKVNVGAHAEFHVQI